MLFVMYELDIYQGGARKMVLNYALVLENPFGRERCA